MPSLSPGLELTVPSSFTKILPGTPTESLQAVTTFSFRWKRYIVYASGRQLNILRSATELVQAVTFEQDIVAVKADESIDVTARNGRIVVTDGGVVSILEPWTDPWNRVFWRKTMSLQREDAGDKARTLCWGNDGELLVGGSRQLSLFNTLPNSRNSTPTSSPIEKGLQRIEARQTLWSKHVSSPLLFTACNPSASLIATCGIRDRLVKIWRRLSFEEGLFDHAYLPHPGLVTHLEWRSPDLSRPDDDDVDMRRISTLSLSARHEEDPDVLYTFCTDGVLRIWKSGNHHDLDILTLYTTLDLVSAIPHSPLLPTSGTRTSPKPSRYAFVLPAGALVPGINAPIAKRAHGTQQNGKVQLSHSLEHLKEISLKHPDAIVTLDGHGRMSAWGVQSIGHKRRPDTPSGSAGQAFHIAHAEDFPIRFAEGTHARFETWFEGDEMNVLVHHFDGEVEWWRGGVEAMFSPAAAGSGRVKLLAKWSGHDANVDSETPIQPTDVSFVTAILGESSEEWVAVHASRHPRKQGWSRLVGVNKVGLLTRREIQSTCLQSPAHGDKHPAVAFASALVTPSAMEATADFAALFSAEDGKLVVLNLEDGYVEHCEPTSRKLRHMRFISPDTAAQSIGSGTLLALGYAESVDVIARSRYEATSTVGRGVWHHVKRVSIADLGLTIQSVTWTKNSQLAVVAGNITFFSNDKVSGHELNDEFQGRIGLADDDSTDVLKLALVLNQPLPVWHPRSLLQLIWHGHFRQTLGIWIRLERTLKFFSEGDVLDATLGVEPAVLLAEMAQTSDDGLSSEISKSLWAQLQELDLPGISRAEQKHLQLLLDTTVFIQEHVGSLDQNGLRYLFSWKLQVLELEHTASTSQISRMTKLTNGDKPAPVAVPTMAWREVAFAYHSSSQQPLLEILSAHYDTKLDWPTVCALGIPIWLQAIHAAQSEGSSLASLEQLFDSLAQTAYRSTYPPDPAKASLYFLALRKKATLLALWRVAVGNREQRSTMQFLRRDFAVEENRTAARKNAYALMGKRRFEYAAAFFLLADDAASAVRILAGQCEDLALAVAVARLYCGDGSKVLCDFVEERVLPSSMKLGSRWMTSWAFSLLGRASDAAKSFIVPFEELGESSELLPRNWQQDDPVTILLYRHLRDTAVKPGKGKISLGAEKYELQASLRSARLLRRMGLWLLALELVKTWKFVDPVESDKVGESSDAEETNGVHEDTDPQTSQAPRSALDDFDTPPTNPVTAQPAKSMLDDFDTPSTKPTPTAPKSMLDDFTPSAPAKPPETSAADARAAKAAELLAKMKAKKDAAAKPEEQGSEKGKKGPTQFKEPEASSILDSFGF